MVALKGIQDERANSFLTDVPADILCLIEQRRGIHNDRHRRRLEPGQWILHQLALLARPVTDIVISTRFFLIFEHPTIHDMATKMARRV